MSYPVNFKTDKALYDKYRVICTIKKEKFQETHTKLIENYIKENENLINKPEIQENITQELPLFYDKPEKWLRYFRKIDNEQFEELSNRVNFWRFLLHEYVINKGRKVEHKIILHQFESFAKSKEYKFLSNGGIIPTVQKLDPILLGGY